MLRPKDMNEHNLAYAIRKEGVSEEALFCIPEKKLIVTFASKWLKEKMIVCFFHRILPLYIQGKHLWEELTGGGEPSF